MEFKTYGTVAKVEANGDILIVQSSNGEDYFVTLTRCEAGMLAVWLQEILRNKDEVVS